jgi:hypothetical protein
MVSYYEKNALEMLMIRNSLIFLAFCGSPTCLFAFCGDFGLGVAPGFTHTDWLSKAPLLSLFLIICFAPLAFFIWRFARRLHNV